MGPGPERQRLRRGAGSGGTGNGGARSGERIPVPVRDGGGGGGGGGRGWCCSDLPPRAVPPPRAPARVRGAAWPCVVSCVAPPPRGRRAAWAARGSARAADEARAGPHYNENGAGWRGHVAATVCKSPLLLCKSGNISKHLYPKSTTLTPLGAALPGGMLRATDI